MLRLFLALDLPGDARRSLAAWRDSELTRPAALRPVPERSLHVTLVFLGATEEGAVGALWACVAGAVGASQAARFAPAGVRGVPRGRPRLVALDLADEGAHAAGLHREVVAALAASRLYEPDERPFWPHVTLARVRRGARADRWNPAAPWSQAFTSSRLTLYESRPASGGAEYRPLEQLELPAWSNRSPPS